MITNTKQVPDITMEFAYTLSHAWKTLFEERNLYQSVTPDFSQIKLKLGHRLTCSAVDLLLSGGVTSVNQKEKVDPEERLKMYLRKQITSSWILMTDYSAVSKMQHLATVTAPVLEPMTFSLPTIHINCNHCSSILPPHHSGYASIGGPARLYDFGISDKGCVQVFHIPYLCQSCKKEPIVFSVRRQGVKLTLVGRSHLRSPQIPSFIPQEESRHLKDAVIAKESGQVLPALFMLRVFVEQYLRRILKVDTRMTGDELGDAYAKLLDEDFPKKPVSLKVVYSELSLKIHGAEASVEQFLKSLKDITTHFDHLRLAPLKIEA